MFPNLTGLLRLRTVFSRPATDTHKHATNAAEWAAKLGMNLQSSTLKIDESGHRSHSEQAERMTNLRAASKKPGTRASHQGVR